MEGGGGEIGGPSIFFLDGVWGALKCQKMTLGGGGVFKFLVSSIPTEQHDAWVLKDLILIQFYTKSSILCNTKTI